MLQHRTSVSAGAGRDFIISDGSLDRHGTRINPAGWDLSSFKRNPIALFGHEGGFPIGKWEDVRVDGDKVRGRLVMADAGTSARIDELRALVDQGILRAVSVGFAVKKYGEPGRSAFDYEQQELLECSLVSVPSNTNALAAARSLRISPETLSLAFGEHANGASGRAITGGHAEAEPPTKPARAPLPSPPEIPTTMQTLSQRIEHAQNEVNVRRDRLTELTSADDLDVEALEIMNEQIVGAERALAALKATEQRIGINAGGPAAPAVIRRPLSVPQREIKGLDLLVRAVTARGISHFARRPLDQVLQERYPDHEATGIITRADQTIGTTTVSGWASELVQTAYADFMDALVGVSIYPQLRDRSGSKYSFDGNGTVSIPARTAGGAGGGFVAEGAPIRVGRVTVSAVTMTARKLGVIVPFSRELAKRSTPNIESVVRQAILDDTGVILDAALLDAVAGDTVRPAGLLNGVTTVGVGFGGGDYQAVIEDFKALLAPFIAANAADNITVIMNPAQGLALSLMPGPDGTFGWAERLTSRFNIVESTRATSGRLIAIRTTDFATALGDTPEFDVSEQATVHMEDTTPLEIVSGTGPTTADPVRSFWQTGTMGVRMIMDVSWKMKRTGMVQWVNGTSW